MKSYIQIDFLVCLPILAFGKNIIIFQEEDFEMKGKLLRKLCAVSLSAVMLFGAGAVCQHGLIGQCGYYSGREF